MDITAAPVVPAVMAASEEARAEIAVGREAPAVLEEEDPLWMVGGLRWAAATAAAGGTDLHPLAEAADAAAVCSL